MANPETLEDFYKRKFDWIPDNIKNEIRHFNLFKLEPVIDGNRKPIPYKRRDFYKVMLVIGDIDFLYADKVVSIKKQALVFSNPQIPYTVEKLDRIKGGCYCIFNTSFFQMFGYLNQYSVFQPLSPHVFEISDQQVILISKIYEKMFEEINSNYIHKYDVLRNLVFELIHFAEKMEPSSEYDGLPINAAQRISTLFLELLERQFPLDEDHPTVYLRTPSDFATQLNIHVNHLNRALKETMQQSTSKIIASRILKESEILLKSSKWDVSEIAYALKFKEVTHFNNFFKKHKKTSPLKFRKAPY